MITCDNLKCSLQWFHFESVGLSKAPKVTVDPTLGYPESQLSDQGWRFNSLN